MVSVQYIHQFQKIINSYYLILTSVLTSCRARSSDGEVQPLAKEEGE